MTPDQRARAVVFNSINPALRSVGLWAKLTSRQVIADRLMAALAEHGLAVVPVDDLVATIRDADAYDSEYGAGIGNPSNWERLDRLRAAVSASPPTPGHEHPPPPANPATAATGARNHHSEETT
ncbi:hypothetical protein ACLQ2R_17470 [Streptosporangium sp. DT93]|uniref:hypothetical protein n=1 Tax=Streptosporangium sp. DT93 TaxID=3393428 RepID=UPI003CEE1AFD